VANDKEATDAPPRRCQGERAGVDRGSIRRLVFPVRPVFLPGAECRRKANAVHARIGRLHAVRVRRVPGVSVRLAYEALTMPLNPKLLEILACPKDKGPLLYFADEESLYNPRLKLRYRITDDIPIMLIDEAETVDDGEDQRLRAKAQAEGIKPTFDPAT
jgi:uncharacterized protein YbaR (Trm112 family)